MGLSTMMLILCMLCFEALGSPLIKRAAGYTSIVAFGDSFTDNGNGSARITNGTWPSNPAYFNHHFSNGPVWIEDVAANLSVPLHDYATGGATTTNSLVQGYTGPGSTIPVPGIYEQVTSFLSNTPSDVDISSTLFVIFGGLNDIFFNPNLTASQIADALSTSTTTLQNAEAQHFLLLNYYDASLIPYDTYITPPDKAQLHKFSIEFGTQLAELQECIKQQGLAQAIYVDLLPVFARFYFYGEPESHGFDRFGAYGSCLTGAYQETGTTSLCSDPDRHVFWDEYHPTSHTHQLIAQTVLDVL